jgi:hypothetical protein
MPFFEGLLPVRLVLREAADGVCFLDVVFVVVPEVRACMSCTVAVLATSFWGAAFAAGRSMIL